MNVVDFEGQKSNFQRLEESLEYGAKHFSTRTAVTYLNSGGFYECVSYYDLNAKACRLAALLQSRYQVYARHGTPFVGIFLARNLNQIVAILATLIAGAAFVPLALDSPSSNFSAIVDQTQLRWILTDSEQHIRLNDLLVKVERTEVLALDISKFEEFYDKVALESATSGNGKNPAYVLFSSGTTGTPKGIVTPHSAVRTYCAGANRLYQASSVDKWLRAASYTFDSSIDELFCPLTIGAEIIIQPDGALASFESYLKFLEDSGATILTMTTALWHQLANYVLNEKKSFPPKIRIVSIGGEAGMTSVLEAWRARFKDYPRFLNGYGPTEATVCATYWEGRDNVGSPILPIGRPLPGYRCYVLDPLTKVPVDSDLEGVLFISGPGLAIGYLSNPDLTESKFLPNPWAESPDYSRMYNTGDLVRVDKDGVFHFIGRMDLQIKVRGFRVEVESVEACLSTMPGVKEVAIVSSTEQQSLALNAYIVTSLNDDSALFVDDIIEYCSARLAHYEIPGHFYHVKSLPHTASQKIDRRALNSVLATPFPSREEASKSGKLGTVNAILADLWCQCLDNVSPTSLSHQSHFIHLGGHSLTLIALAAKIYSATGISLNALELLNNPTLSQMSQLLDRPIPTLESKEAVPEDKQLGNGEVVGRTLPLSRAQARLYAVQQTSPESPVFNDGVAIKITGDVSYEEMYSALRSILQRHEILRVKLVQDTTAQVLQEILPFDDLLFDTIFCHEHLDGEAAAQHAHEIFVKPFRIFENPLIHIALLSTGAAHILLVCAHHIIWDGFSDRVFLEELVSFYQGKQPPPSSSYFKHCYRLPATDEARLSSLVSYLDLVPQVIEIPIDFVRPDSQTFSHGRTVSFDVDQLSVSRLVDRLSSTPFACLMTAFAVTLHLNAACQMEFMIGIPFANRLNVGEANAIGFFINTLPLRVNFTDISRLDELHVAIRRDLLFLAGLQDVPFDSLVNALNFNRLKSSASHLQVLLNFIDAPEGDLDQRAKYSRFPLSNGAAHTDLVCFIERGKDGSLAGEIEYDSEIFAQGSIESFASAFVHILNAWSNQPYQSIHGLQFSDTSAHIPRQLGPVTPDTSFGAYLASAASQHWDRPAVYDDNTESHYSYKELFLMSQRIQECLRPFKKLNGLVVLLLERRVDALAAEIGVNLAGLAFVPCDVSQPLSRIREIIADSNPVCVIAHPQVLRQLGISEEDFSVSVLLLTASVYGDLTSACSPEDITTEDPSKASYMIYTSGSTGKPKGIVIGHSSIIQLVEEVSSLPRSGATLHSIATANLAWDMSFLQIYPALATGGIVKIPKTNGEKDGEYISALMNQPPPVNFIATTPSSIRMWLDQTQGQSQLLFPDGLHCVFLGGEELTPSCVLRVFSQASGSPNVRVIHPYGPTEATIFNAYGILKHSDLRRLTKCRRVPVDILHPNAAMTVVNAAGHELPRGFVGELVIWGPCLLLEYHGMPELNEKKMLIKDGVRGWRTGDLGRHLPSDEYEIFGRMDSMCKVKGGFRVDLAEIETHIRSYTDVDEACVSLADVVQENERVSERQIVAHVRFNVDFDCQINPQVSVVLNGLYQHLSHCVPAYMVPDYVVPVDSFPVVDSNKFDKSKLPKATSAHKFIMVVDEEAKWTTEDESRRELIEAILRIFTSVLSIDRKLSHKDNFYHCGGNSLLATHTTSLIRREFGVPLPFTAIITNPTASELAEFVESMQDQADRSIRLPRHIIPLQPAGFIPKPKAMLFAFPFIGGDLDLLPRVVNQLDNAKLGLVTYGVCWESGRKLNTLESAAEAYAKSIAAVAGTTPCFLLGWCFGGMIACKAALHLPKATTHIILFDVLHLKLMDRFTMGKADYARAFGEYLCKVWFGPGLRSAERPGNKAAVIQAVLDANLDWHDTASLIKLARRHVTLPPWVTNMDLAERLGPLADSHDLMVGVYGRACCTPPEAINIEERVVVNLQATDGLNVIFDTEIGLGWSSYEIIDTDHDTIGYLPIARQKVLAALRRLIV